MANNIIGLNEMFGIPDSQELVAVIAIGVREKDPHKPPRKEIDEIAKFF